MSYKRIVLQLYPNARVTMWHGKFRVSYHQRGRRPLVALCSLFHTPVEAWKQAALNITIRREINVSLRDKCQVCKGTKGGVRGNENIVDGVIMCDYCHADSIKKGEKKDGQPTK